MSLEPYISNSQRPNSLCRRPRCAICKTDIAGSKPPNAYSLVFKSDKARQDTLVEDGELLHGHHLSSSANSTPHLPVPPGMFTLTVTVTRAN